MTKLQTLAIRVAIITPLAALAFWAIDAAFGPTTSRDWIAPVAIGLLVSIIASIWPIQRLRQPKTDA
jgi:hypothetical protein